MSGSFGIAPIPAVRVFASDPTTLFCCFIHGLMHFRGSRAGHVLGAAQFTWSRSCPCSEDRA